MGEYMKRIKALQFYVYEDDLKAGDSGEAAVIAAEREEESHLVNLKENEEENKRVAALRQARLQKEAEERKVRIQMELQDYDVKELERLEKKKKILLRPLRLLWLIRWTMNTRFKRKHIQ